MEPPDPGSPRDAAFPKRLRLRKSGDYRRVQGRGRRVRGRHLLALVLPGEVGESRVGITVSRKVGNAVVRNRVKRWLREAIRHERGRLGADGGRWDVVLIAYSSAAEAGAVALRQDVGVAFDQVARQAGRRGASAGRMNKTRPGKGPRRGPPAAAGQP